MQNVSLSSNMFSFPHHLLSRMQMKDLQVVFFFLHFNLIFRRQGGEKTRKSFGGSIKQVAVYEYSGQEMTSSRAKTPLVLIISSPSHDGKFLPRLLFPHRRGPMATHLASQTKRRVGFPATIRD